MSLKKATFSERIKTALKMNGITQQELAERTNINKGNMSRYVNGNANPKIDKIELMANVLGIDGAWLMGYDVPMDRNYEKDKIIVVSFYKFVVGPPFTKYYI